MSLDEDKRDLYWRLDRMGRVRLSPNFQMRQFLHSEVATIAGLINYPDDPDAAIHAGERLCQRVLEPLIDHYGPIIVRSGFRSAHVNAFGATHGLQCASNEKNYAYHIWDHPDADGHRGATACIVIPAVRDAPNADHAVEQLIAVLETLDFHDVAFFKRELAFNIGWREKPVRKIVPPKS